MGVQPPDTVRLFYCYAQNDSDLRKKLEQSLAGLKREGFLEDWSDAEIKAGQATSQEIEGHLERADILLLLISPSFLASDYCYQTLLQRALQRHRAGDAVAILVLLRPVDWQDPSFDILPRLPSTGKPATAWVQRDEAFNDIARGIRSQLKEVWLSKGDTYYQAKRYDEALSSFEQAIHQNPAFGPAYIRRGSVLRDMGRFQEAAASLDVALQQNPMDANLHFQVGTVLYDAREYDRAVAAFDQAIQLNHLLVSAHIYKGLALEQKGSIDQALETYHAYLRLHPNDPLVSYFWRDLLTRKEAGEFWRGSASQISSAAQSLLGSFSRSVLGTFFGSSRSSKDPVESFFSTVQEAVSGVNDVIDIFKHQLQQWKDVLQVAFTRLPGYLQHSESEDGMMQGTLDDLLKLEVNILEEQLKQIQETLQLAQSLSEVPVDRIDSLVHNIGDLWNALAKSITEKRLAQQHLSEQLLNLLRQKQLEEERGMAPLL